MEIDLFVYVYVLNGVLIVSSGFHIECIVLSNSNLAHNYNVQRLQYTEWEAESFVPTCSMLLFFDNSFSHGNWQIIPIHFQSMRLLISLQIHCFVAAVFVWIPNYKLLYGLKPIEANVLSILRWARICESHKLWSLTRKRIQLTKLMYNYLWIRSNVLFRGINLLDFKHVQMYTLLFSSDSNRHAVNDVRLFLQWTEILYFLWKFNRDQCIFNSVKKRIAQSAVSIGCLVTRFQFVLRTKHEIQLNLKNIWIPI